MSAFKLVVVDPFENFKRGDQIHDQEFVKNILNPNHAMHSYERHVRKVFMSEVEKQMYVAPLKENKEPEQNENEVIEAQIQLESINPNAA